MLRNARSPDLIRVEAGAIELPPVLFQFCSFVRVMLPKSKWFVIHEVLEREIEGSKLKEIYYLGTLIGDDHTPAIVRCMGQHYSCGLGKPVRIGNLVLSWPKEKNWIMLDTVRGAPRPGMMSLKSKAPVQLGQVVCEPSGPIGKGAGWRRFPFPGHVEFVKGSKAKLLLGVDLTQRIGFAVYHKDGPIEDVQILPWAEDAD